MPRDPAPQASLFDDVDPNALVTVTGSGAKLSTSQRKFNRLTDQLRHVRERLKVWEVYGARFRQRAVAELEPALEGVRRAQRQMALRIDRLLSERGPRLKRRQGEALIEQLGSLVGEVLLGGPDDEIEGLQEKYRVDRGGDDETDLAGVEFGEEMIGRMFGADVLDGHKAKNLDELLQHAGDRLLEGAAPKPEGGGGRKQSAHAEREAQRKARAAEEATASVKSIFRKLASALHPDRESDAAERERKTALMQRVNQAYERGDLLELLTLQIEIEQIDAEDLAKLPEERLRHYIHVLDEQLVLLKGQVRQIAMDYEEQLGSRVVLTEPKLVDAALTGYVRELQDMERVIERDLLRFDDPKQLRELLRELSEQYEDREAAGRVMMEAMLRETTPPKRRKKKGPR